MPTESLARSFFDKLLAPGTDHIANIRALVNSTPLTTESDWLDVKGEHRDPKQREKKSKELWSEALGGFANNQGGVLIWGLDARRTEINGRTIDAICSDVPVDDPEAFRVRLMDWRRQATDPPLSNVEIVPVPLPGIPLKGYVVCFIPEGTHKPYRSEDAERNYYLRASDNTVVMSRSVLASMFYPKTQATFRVRANLTYSPIHNKQYTDRMYVAEMLLTVDLENIGTASAKNLTVLVKPELPGLIAEPRINVDYQWLHGSYGGRYQLRVKDITVHQGQGLRAFALGWQVQEAPRADFLVVPVGGLPKFEITVLCENQAPQMVRPQFDAKELLDTHKTQWEGCSED